MRNILRSTQVAFMPFPNCCAAAFVTLAYRQSVAFVNESRIGVFQVDSHIGTARCTVMVDIHNNKQQYKKYKKIG